MKRVIVGLFFLLIMTACNNTGIISHSVPARIIDVNSVSLHELQRVIASALNLKSIALSRDALTKSNILIIERKSRHGAGYDLGKPKVFRLIKSGMQCVLIYQGSNKRWVLRNTKCEPTSVPLTV